MPSFNEWTEADIAQMKALRAIAESINPAFIFSDANTMSQAVLRAKKAEALEPLLPWILNRVLDGSEQSASNLTAEAVDHPQLHDCLIPLMPSLLDRFMKAYPNAAFVAAILRAIVRNRNRELVEIARPFFPETLKGAASSARNFAAMALHWLEIGGSTEALYEPLRNIVQLDGVQSHYVLQKADGNRIKDLGMHLCDDKFATLINHQAVQADPITRKMLYSFSARCLKEGKLDYVVMAVIKEEQALIASCNTNFSLPACTYVLGNDRTDDYRKLSGEPSFILHTAMDLFDAVVRDTESPERKRIAALASEEIQSVLADRAQEIEREPSLPAPSPM